MEGFGYDSFVLDDDDSDPEEFVNIVVNEIASGISDDQAELLANEVETIRRSSLIPFPADDSSDLDSVDRATPIQPSLIPSVRIQTADQISLSGSFKMEQTTEKEKSPFSFFKRKRDSTSLLRKRRTSDTSLLSLNKKDNNQFESSLNFEPSTTPLPKKKVIRIVEPDRIVRNTEQDDVTSLSKEMVETEATKSTSKKTQRKFSDIEWDNISQHNIEALSVVEPSPVEEEKEPTGQRTTHQNANKVFVSIQLF